MTNPQGTMPDASVKRTVSIVVLVASLLFLAGLGFLLFVRVPQFTVIFADMGVKLPLLTQIVVRTSGSILAMAGFAGVCLATIAKEFLPYPRLTLWLNVGVGAGAIVLGFLVWFSLDVPMTALLNAVQGGR